MKETFAVGGDSTAKLDPYPNWEIGLAPPCRASKVGVVPGPTATGDFAANLAVRNPLRDATEIAA